MTDKKNKDSEQIRERQMTYELYAEMPDDGQRYEIIDGYMEMMAGPTTVHQAVSGELEFILKQSCKSDYLIYDAPLDVILSDTNVLQPDIVMIHRSRLQIVTKRGIEGAPDLVVEILSPSTRKRDKLIKMKTYAKFAVPEYWVIDPDARTLEQYSHDGGQNFSLLNLFEADDQVKSDKLPCVSFVVSDIFKEIPDFA